VVAKRDQHRAKGPKTKEGVCNTPVQKIGACVGNFQRELEEATQSPVPGFGFRVPGSNFGTSKLLNFGTADLPASPINPDSTSPGHHCSSAWAKKIVLETTKAF